MNPCLQPLPTPASPLLHSRIRDFQEDLRSKRSQQASDDVSGIGKFTIMAPQDRYNARTLVAPEFNMVRGALCLPLARPACLLGGRLGRSVLLVLPG